MEKSCFVEYFRKFKYNTYEILLFIVNTLGCQINFNGHNKIIFIHTLK